MNDKIRDIRDKPAHDELFVCVTRCKDYANYMAILRGKCKILGEYRNPDDYCSYAERIDEDAD